MDQDTILKIKQLILSGYSDSDLKRALKKSKVSAKDGPRVIAAAWENIIDDADISNVRKKAWCIEALRNVYSKMIASEDYTGAKAVIKEIVSLSGLKKVDLADRTDTHERNLKNVAWPDFKKAGKGK